MKRFNFPFAYEPKVNLKNTIVYSSKYKQSIVDYLIDKYKCIFIDPSIIDTNVKSSIAYYDDDRIMGFDNKMTNSIFLLDSIQDNYLFLLSQKIKNENFITFAPRIKRDAKQTNLDSIISWKIDVELSMLLSKSVKNFSSILQQTYISLINLAKSKDLLKIYSNSIKKISTNHFSIIDAQKLEDKYPTLPLQEAFIHYCSQHKFVIVQNSFMKLKSGRILEPSNSIAHDRWLSCTLYVYDEVNNKPISLISICKHPNGKIAKEQLINTNPTELTNDLYNSIFYEDQKKFNTLLSINFSHLLFFILDKIHLAEVVKSVWPDDFINFVEKENIEIF